MATVLPFGSPEPFPSIRKSESSAQRRVRRGSRALALMFGILFVAAALLLVTGIFAVLFYKGEYLRIGPGGCYIGVGPANSVPFGSLPLHHRTIYAAVGVLRYLPIPMLFWHLRGLFALYAEGKVFSPRAGIAFAWIGGWLCAYALMPLLCHFALDLSGFEIDKVWLHLESVQAFVLGLLFLVIGQVMQVGHEIERDAEGFV